MSFAEIAECVKQLTLEEKLQLQTVVAEEIDRGDGMPPGWFTPGMTVHTGSMVTTDEAGMRLIYEAAGIPLSE